MTAASAIRESVAGSRGRADEARSAARIRTRIRYMVVATVFIMVIYPLIDGDIEGELRAASGLAGSFGLGQLIVVMWPVHLVSLLVAMLLAGAIPGYVFARLRESTADALAEVQEVHQAQSEFLSVISHEMRTPLTGIQGFSELLGEEGLSPEEVREYAGDINENAKRLDRLIGDLLDMQRLARGRLSVTLVPMDLAAAARATAYSLQAASTDHRLVLDLDRPLPVRGDADRLRQVLTNLIGNALKYASPGEVRISGAVEGDRVHLRVADGGPGIPAGSCERIFEQYYRVPSVSGSTVKGTGLGLPIVRGLVELHGGRVWCESDTGRGSVFHVVLPLDRSQAS